MSSAFPVAAEKLGWFGSGIANFLFGLVVVAVFFLGIFLTCGEFLYKVVKVFGRFMFWGVVVFVFGEAIALSFYLFVDAYITLATGGLFVQ
jgi:hypothetical protein